MTGRAATAPGLESLRMPGSHLRCGAGPLRCGVRLRCCGAGPLCCIWGPLRCGTQLRSSWGTSVVGCSFSCRLTDPDPVAGYMSGRSGWGADFEDRSPAVSRRVARPGVRCLVAIVDRGVLASPWGVLAILEADALTAESTRCSPTHVVPNSYSRPTGRHRLREVCPVTRPVMLTSATGVRR